MKPSLLCVLFGLLVFMGCGGKEGNNKGSKVGMKDGRPPRMGAAKKEGAEEAERAPDAPRQRKIKYSGRLAVIVEDFAQASQELEQVVKTNKGYIASSDTRTR